MSSLRPLNILRGFSLMEILVVVAIVSVLAVVGVANFSDSSASARDAQRQADLKNLQNAIETYRSQNGRYPYQATTTGALADGWSGQLLTNFAPADNTGQYIVGLAPEYISVLPTDPRLNGTDSGYVYRTNAEGTVYKLKALKTVETEVVTYQHPLKACDVRVGPNAAGNVASAGPSARDPRLVGMCGYVAVDAVSSAPPPECNQYNDMFRKSYGVWGGMAPLQSVGGLDIYAPDPLATVSGASEPAKNNSRQWSIKNTADVICK